MTENAHKQGVVRETTKEGHPDYKKTIHESGLSASARTLVKPRISVQDLPMHAVQSLLLSMPIYKTTRLIYPD